MSKVQTIKPVTSATDWSKWKDFSPRELQCRGTGKIALDPRFMDALQKLRTALGKSIVITSGCRAADYNARIGGHPRSLHICDAPQHEGQAGTIAIDAVIAGGAYRGDLTALAWRHGWSIGFGNGFVHLDRRGLVGLPQTTFDYYK